MIDPAKQPSPSENSRSSPGEPVGPPQDLYDPYSLWSDLPPGSALPYSQVLLGFASWLRGVYRPMWDQQSPHSTSWHLARDRGLHAWCLYEAAQRLKERYQDAYSDADFMVIHLAEALLGDEPDAFKSPFWTPLFTYHQLRDDKTFFRYIARVLDRKDTPAYGHQRLLAILYDRAYCPLEYWSSPAIAEFWRKCVDANTPSPGLIRKWLERMNLELAYPPIVTAFNPGGITRLDKSAARLHGLPDL
jgi:hypothetical protein